MGVVSVSWHVLRSHLLPPYLTISGAEKGVATLPAQVSLLNPTLALVIGWCQCSAEELPSGCGCVRMETLTVEHYRSISHLPFTCYIVGVHYDLSPTACPYRKKKNIFTPPAADWRPVPCLPPWVAGIGWDPKRDETGLEDEWMSSSFFSKSPNHQLSISEYLWGVFAEKH